MTDLKPPFIQLFDDFKFHLTLAHLQVFHEIQNITKRVGQPVHLPDDLCWMVYENHTKTPSPYHQDAEPGSIAVTQNTQKYLSNDVDTIHKELTRLVPGYAWDKSQIHFMRTRGDVLPHVGGTRTCSLNIGLLNTSSSRTDVSMSGYEGYHPENPDLWSYILDDGEGVLLDVTKAHSVYCLDEKVTRYQITYGFDKSLEEVHALMGSPVFEPTKKRALWTKRAT